MAVLKYSKQREAIRDFLAHSEEHPTNLDIGPSRAFKRSNSTEI